MDVKRIKDLAGIETVKSEFETNPMLNEATVIPADVSYEQLAAMFDAGRRALGLVNRLRNPEDKQKHLTAVFTNVNRIRAALARMIKQGIPPENAWTGEEPGHFDL